MCENRENNGFNYKSENGQEQMEESSWNSAGQQESLDGSRAHTAARTCDYYSFFHIALMRGFGRIPSMGGR